MSKSTLYSTPPEHRFELHFPRSRFNTELEDILLLVSAEIIRLGSQSKEQFAVKIDSYLSKLRGGRLTAKTIANQRTEMLRLYGLAKYQDTGDGIEVITGNRTLLLVQNQDVPRFFKSVCNRFQFPNGINKIQYIEQHLIESIRFKPAQYLIKLLTAGNEKTGRTFAVTAKEVAHLVFNDKRVTTGQEQPEKRVNLFLDLRKKEILCDGTGDVIRYARDFLTFMTWANLLTEYEGKYFLNQSEKNALDFIANDSTFFDDFDLAKQGNIVERKEIKDVLEGWETYYADADFAEEEALKTTLASFEKTTVEIVTEDNETETVTTGYDLPKAVMDVVQNRYDTADKQTTKQIGDEGEEIMYALEKERVAAERPDLMGLVRIVSNDTSLGFDIQSVFADGIKKYIEVKTTKRNFAPGDFNSTAYFNISYNEWMTAKQHGDSYFIARVIIAKEKLSVFIIRNPYKQFEENKVTLYPVDYRLMYKENAGEFLIKDKLSI